MTIGAIVLEVLFLAFVIGSDLISKELVVSFFGGVEDSTHVLLEDIFTLHYVKNNGASFGIFAGKQDMLIALTLVIMVLLVILLIWQKDMPKMARYAVLLIVGGGIGNLVDRMAFGYVRDFIDYTFLDNMLMPVFGRGFATGNIADIYLCVGVLMVIIYVLFAFDEKDYSVKWRKKGIA